LCLSDGLEAGVGDAVLTPRNESELITSGGDMVRNGQRWVVDSIGYDGSITARRCDDTSATVTLKAITWKSMPNSVIPLPGIVSKAQPWT
jgi:hypothetical protein